jgi:hypothetical protein
VERISHAAVCDFAPDNAQNPCFVRISRWHSNCDFIWAGINPAHDAKKENAMEWRIRLRCAAVLLGVLTVVGPSYAQEKPIRWYSVDAQKNVKLHVYLFYSERCPHCIEALKFVSDLESKHSWVEFTRYETSRYPQNLDYYRYMASQVGRAAGQVPAFFFCKQLEIGYDSHERTGKRLEASLQRCHDALTKQIKKTPESVGFNPSEPPPGDVLAAALFLVMDQEPEYQLELPAPESKVDLPWWGEVEAAELSLPLLTLTLAGCDAFNPCAFFVLLFLLSLMVHAHSRVRMLLVGGIFVFASGLVYFLFMAAWLNLFFVAGHLPFITLAAGIVATVVALVNIKDYFWFKQGPSLSIPDQAKPGLFQRMTALVGEQRMLAMITGTIVLAGITNLYELLCTSGFPMIFTRILTLRELPTGVYYLYLVFYNIIYVVPLAAIVVVFTFTLGSRKLSEEEGRILKLLSGMMMLILGTLMMAAPELLTSISAAAGALVLAVALTAGIVLLNRQLPRWFGKRESYT